MGEGDIRIKQGLNGIVYEGGLEEKLGEGEMGLCGGDGRVGDREKREGGEVGGGMGCVEKKGGGGRQEGAGGRGESVGRSRRLKSN